MNLKKILNLSILLLICKLNAQCWQSVQCGNYHTVGIKTDGTVWAWGANFNGQLGDGTLVDKHYPIEVSGISDMRSLFVGYYTNFMIKNDGSLWAWGSSAYGIFGNGSIASSRTSPLQIGNSYNWKSIASESFHTIGLKEDGSLWATGSNNYGQLGNNTVDASNYFVQIGTNYNWDKIAVGTNYSVAIRTDGTLWGWGANFNSQLGNGNTTNLLIPTQIGTATNWVAVSAGYAHTLALKSDGTLWAWGNNTAGQIGDGTIANRSQPVRIGIDSDWVSIDTGDYFSLAKKINNSVWFWGTGRQVNGNFVGTYSPMQINATTDWSNFSGGYKHLALVDNSYALSIRGWNDWGQLGNDTTISNYILSQVSCDRLENPHVSEEKDFSVFPIPTANFLNIQNNSGYNIDRISIFDLTGKKIAEQSGAITQIDIRNLQSGIYFLELESQEGKQIEKFIKK